MNCSKRFGKTVAPSNDNCQIKQDNSNANLNRIALNIFRKELNSISVNPFVSHWTWTKSEAIYCYTIGILMNIIRIPPALFFILLAGLFAKIILILINICSFIHMTNTEPLRKFGRLVAFLLLRISLFFIGFYWIRIQDKRLDKTEMASIIVAAPHSTFFDIILILKLKNPTFVSKIENINMPIIGNVLRLCNGIYVNRANKNSRQETVRNINERAAKGEKVLIFPEGTCTNREALIQFKMGAFIPNLPVQPVLIRFDQADDQVDTITWTWEGPGPLRLLLHSMTRLSINCEITILPKYVPNAAEKANIQLFAHNVAKIMCTELGILQSFYSLEDVPFLPMAKTIGLFRSPLCLLFLKLANKIGKRHLFDDKQNVDKLSKLKIKFSMIGEDDLKETDNHKETYNPRNTPRSNTSHISRKSSLNWQFIQNLMQFKTIQKPITSVNDQQNQYQYLPISNMNRPLYKTMMKNNCPFDLNRKEQLIFETFLPLIEHCITSLEKNFQFRAIESSDDIISLLNLVNFVDSEETLKELRGSDLFIDLVKMLEMNVPYSINTLHLLIVLNLCDVRERDLWKRIETVVKLFYRMHVEQNAENGYKNNKDINEYLTLDEFRTFLWYSLGLSEFNDNYFVNNRFTYFYLRNNLTKLFWRAINENAPQLIG